MIRYPTNFSKLISGDEKYVTYGDNNKGKFIGIRNISNKLNLLIKNVFLVDG